MSERGRERNRDEGRDRKEKSGDGKDGRDGREKDSRGGDRDRENNARRRSRSREAGDKDRDRRRGSRDKDKGEVKEKAKDSRDEKPGKEKDKKERRRRSGSQSPRRRKSGSRKRSQSRGKKKKSRSNSAEKLKLKEEQREREKNRDEYTVFVSQIHPKVDERDLFDFFSHVGKVEDIRMIRDQRTQRSKGMCYVEFWEKEAVTKAVSLTGQLVNNFPITVQVTQSEKNKPPPDLEDGSTMRLYVGQLHLSVSDGDLRPVFEAFGPIEFIDLHKDPMGQSRGFGFVQYKKAADAKQALNALNGLEIAGKPMKVGLVDQTKDGGGASISELDEGAGGLALTAQSRTMLMSKLGRGTFMPAMDTMIPGLAPNSSPAISAPMIQATTCVVVKNMFDPKTETEPDFDQDIREDVEEECSKYGRIKHLFVDKSSSQGHVYLRFSDVSGAQQCIKAFNGRWFASRQITAEFVAEVTYFLKFPKARD